MTLGMEKVLRKIIETLVRGVAYIPLGGASLSFILCFYSIIKSVILLAVNGSLVIPKLHQTVGLDFLHLLMDDRLSGIRRYLIQVAAKGANMPSPLAFLILGTVMLGMGHLILGFARYLGPQKK